MKLVFLLVIALAALVSAQQPGTAAERAAMREEQHPAHYAAVHNFRLADGSHSSSRLTRSTSRVNAHGHRQPHADELSLSFDTADGRSYAFTLLADHQLYAPSMTLDKYAGDVRISSEAPTVLAYHSVNAYDVRPQQPIAHVVLYGSGRVHVKIVDGDRRLLTVDPVEHHVHLDADDDVVKQVHATTPHDFDAYDHGNHVTHGHRMLLYTDPVSVDDIALSHAKDDDKHIALRASVDDDTDDNDNIATVADVTGKASVPMTAAARRLNALKPVNKDKTNLSEWTNCWPQQSKGKRLQYGVATDKQYKKALDNRNIDVNESVAVIITDSNTIYGQQFRVWLQLAQSHDQTTVGGVNDPKWSVKDNDRSQKDSTVQLNTFMAWTSTVKKNTAGLWHLLTGVPMQGGVLGVAYVGMICRLSHGVSMTGSRWDGRSQWKTFAHEVGHNFGAQHSFEDGQGKTGGIMDYGDGKLNRKYQFNTKYRKTEMCEHLAASMKYRNSRYSSYKRYSSVCWTENKQGQPGYQPTCASVSCRSGYTNQREKKCGAKTGGRRLLGEPLSAPAAANDNDDVDATPSPVAATGCISNRESGSIGGTCQQWSECRGKTRQSSAQGAMGCGHLSSLYKCCFDPNGRKAGTTGGTGGVTTGSNGDGACNHDTCCKQNKLCSAVACPAGYTTRKNVDRCSVDYKCQVDCCEAIQTCSSTKNRVNCQAGTRRVLSTTQCSGNFCDRSQCCTANQKCRAHTCGAGFFASSAAKYKACSYEKCTDSECCKPYPTCGDFNAGECTGSTRIIASPSTVVCKGTVCATDECCRPNPSCASYSKCGALKKVDDAELIICKSSYFCKKSECCANATPGDAASCAEFTCPNGGLSFGLVNCTTAQPCTEARCCVPVDGSALKVRADGKCGAQYPAPGSAIGECAPWDGKPCCQSWGRCSAYCSSADVDARDTATTEPADKHYDEYVLGSVGASCDFTCWDKGKQCSSNTYTYNSVDVFKGFASSKGCVVSDATAAHSDKAHPAYDPATNTCVGFKNVPWTASFDDHPCKKKIAHQRRLCRCV